MRLLLYLNQCEVSAEHCAGIDIHLVGKLEWFHCWRMTKDERVRAFDFFHDPVL